MSESPDQPLLAKELKPYTVGVTNHDRGEDDVYWYQVQGVDPYDAVVHAIQRVETESDVECLEGIPIGYEEARRALHQNGWTIHVLEGHPVRVQNVWKAINDNNVWNRLGRAESNLLAATTAVQKLAEDLKPLKSMGLEIDGGLQLAIDGGQRLLTDLTMQCEALREAVAKVDEAAAAREMQRNDIRRQRQIDAELAAQEAEAERKRLIREEMAANEARIKAEREAAEAKQPDSLAEQRHLDRR